MLAYIIRKECEKSEEITAETVIYFPALKIRAYPFRGYEFLKKGEFVPSPENLEKMSFKDEEIRIILGIK